MEKCKNVIVIYLQPQWREKDEKTVELPWLDFATPHITPTNAFLFCPCQQTSRDVDSNSGLSPFRETLDKESVKEEMFSKSKGWQGGDKALRIHQKTSAIEEKMV